MEKVSKVLSLENLNDEDDFESDFETESEDGNEDDSKDELILMLKQKVT